MRSALSIWRLYSWMRLIWQSKMLSGSTAWPEVDFSQSANRALASRLACRKARRNAASSAAGFSLAILSKSVDPAVADDVA